jgi:hypothetical protein
VKSVAAPLGAVAAALLSSCCWVGSCPPPSQPPNARAALDQLRAQHACSRGLRGESRFDSFDEAGRVRAKALFMMAHPESIRFEVLSPLGTSMATLTADGTSFGLLDQEQRVFFMGPADQCNVERFLQVPIPPTALVQLFAGEAPVLIHEPERATLEWEDGAYVIRIHSKHDAHQTIELEPAEEDLRKPWRVQRLRVRQVVVEQAGVELYRAELRDYRARHTAAPSIDPDGLMPALPPSGPVCAAEVPDKVRFIVPIAERDVVFEHQHVEHNPPLRTGAFSQPVPQGVTLRASRCQ